MATEGGRCGSDLEARIAENPNQFSFFQAVRILLAKYKSHMSSSNPGRRRYDADLVRFRTPLSLSFPASEIVAYSPKNDDPVEQGTLGSAARMTVAFMGLTGPQGVLPAHYTESLIARRVEKKDTTAHDFFDLFSHRLVSLFYAAWEKHHFTVRYERGESEGLADYLFDAVGIGTPGLRHRIGRGDSVLNDEVIAYYAGLLGQRPHSEATLAAVVSDYFDAAVRVDCFRGRWLPIPSSEASRLGNESNSCVLGHSAVLGSRAWDMQSKFRVNIGPVRRELYERLIPGGESYAILIELIRFIVGPEHDFEIRLGLTRDDVPSCELGARGSEAPKLGLSTWLKTQDFENDAVDAVFH